MRSVSNSSPWKTNFIFALVIGAVVLFSLNPGIFRSVPTSVGSEVHLFKTMLISIVLEAFPFLLLGVIVSSFMHVFIPDSWFRKLVPRNPLLGVAVACMLGIVFPVCECGLIPIVRRMVAKGMPLYVGVVFILVGPIVNPIVFSATYAAFRTRPDMVYARMGLAIAVGALIGLAVYFFVKGNPIRSVKEGASHRHAHEAHDDHHHHDHHHHDHDPRGASRSPSRSKWMSVFEHAGGEFFDTGKYLIIGSIITAAIQSLVPRSDLIGIGQGEIGSHVFMMGFAFVLSLCSTSDAFVASSFIGTFSFGSLLTFLVFGPMLDFKSTLMLLSLFKTRFVLWLAGAIVVTVLLGSWIVEKFVVH